MARLSRGDVIWADMDPTLGNEQAGRRPVLVLSREEFNTVTRTVIAMAVTARPPKVGFPLTCPLPSGSLRRPSWVKTGQVRTLAFVRLGKRIGRVDESFVDHAVEGLLDTIGH